jgi:manganese/zinc/iron transport system substrate-binding protein
MKRLLPLAFAMPLLLSACGGEAPSPEPGAGPIRIVATVGMVADLVREVAGPLASVDCLVGTGVDPHLYKPSAADVKAMQGADLIFYNGLMLEGKMGDVLVRLAGSGRRVHAVTEELSEGDEYLLGDEEGHDDPHVWMDVKGWTAALGAVERALSAHDPGNADTYRANAEAYRARLAALDDYARQVIASIPEAQRVLVTAHDAFQYLSRAYGIEVRGIQGLSTESEAGVRDIEDLVDFLVERKIPAVFVESSVSDRNVRALIEGAAARGHAVAIGGEIFSDAMGPEGSYEGTYLGMIDHNVTTIARALGGKAPEKGFQGKLTP